MGGGYETLVGVPSLDIGDGLSNTNSLIAMNLQPRTSKWKIVWDMVKHFRSDHSDKWFVPTYYEIREVYKQRSYLQNLTTDSSQHPYYWTSTEFNSSYDAYYADFSNGSIYSTFKFHNDRRTRLCRYLSNSEPLITRASYEVGKVYSIDFIDAMCVYDAGSEQSWGRYLFAEVEDSIQPLSNVNSYSGSETATDIGRGYLNWLILKYSNWKNALYNSIQAVTQYRETQWFLPSLNELKTGLQALGQWNDTFYLSSSEGALNLWGASIRGDDSDTLNRECHIKLFTTDKLINAEYKVGDYREINGIGTVCVLDRLTVDEGRYLFADRHGLAYYLKGVEDDWDTSIDDTKASYAWGTDSSLTNLNRQIGYGYPNTESALATDLVNQDTVWKALRDVQVQRNDNRWFPPSLFELMPLYEQKKNIGSLPYGGQNAWLWSSSCANASTAYSLSFYDGAQGQNAKINPYHARAVYADRKIFFRIGDIVTIDGIESVIIYKRISDNGQNIYILVDRNHDLCYYSLGSDFVDDNDYTNGWGFEWGGTGILTGVSSTEFEAGFFNSNILIDMNLVPSASDWTTVWEALSDFRASHSSQWFLPSQEELELVYDVRELLNNLSCNTNFSYLSSSEDSENYVKTVGMNSGWIHTPLSKRSHLTRCRLCRMATDLDLMLSS